MSLDSLPNEILQLIFEHSYTGLDLVQCRRVCRRWKEIIDTSDGVWRQACRQDYSDTYRDAYRKARLSWQELYKSLSLWRKVDEAEVNIIEMSVNYVSFGNRFSVLENGVIGLPRESCHQRNVIYMGMNNAIGYYDLETLEECSVETFDFLFSIYKENENMLALVNSFFELCVIPKVNKKHFIVGELVYGPPAKQFELFESEIYFRTRHGQFAVSRLEEKDGEIVVNTEMVEDFLKAPILKIRYSKKDEIMILTEEDNWASIFSYCPSSKKHALLIKIYVQDPEILSSTIEMFTVYGMKWIVHHIYSMIERDSYAPDRKTFRYSYDDITVIGTADLKLHIYYKLRGRRDDWQPTISLNLMHILFYKTNVRYSEIEQVDIVEVQNGHKMIVLAATTMFVIEFTHTYF